MAASKTILSKNKSPLPIHSLQKNEPLISVKEIQHKNPYDFTREHRHTYFEVFFFKSGGGNQLIDFIKYPIKKESCYIVFPGQIHLMNREAKALGHLIQFNAETIHYNQLNLLLQKLLFRNNGAILFENQSKKFNHFMQLVLIIEKSLAVKNNYSLETTSHLLHALLFELLNENTTNEIIEQGTDKKLLYQFQLMLEENFSSIHSVSKYASLLNSTEKKLSLLTKKYMGASPLQLIHARLILEIKRILLFEDASHKETAFNLGFDSAATFSQFIKNKTGYTPSELHSQLVEIHK